MVGCETIKTVDDGCVWSEYIYASRNDTDETLRQILAHNMTRKNICEGD
jgi:hypothetical protein